MFSFFNTLSGRFIFSTVFLFALLQLGQWSIFTNTLYEKANEQLDGRLTTAQRFFIHQIDSRDKSLTQIAKNLSIDYTLRESLLLNDEHSAQKVLDRYITHLDSALIFVVDANGKILVRGGSGIHGQLNDFMVSDIKKSLFYKMGPTPYQFITVPIESSLALGDVILGLPLDHIALQEFTHTTGVGAFLIDPENNDTVYNHRFDTKTFFVASSSLPAIENFTYITFPEVFTFNKTLSDKNVYHFRFVSLSSLQTISSFAKKEPVIVFALSVDEALSLFAPLSHTLLVISILGALLFSLVSTLSANKISKPLIELLNGTNLMAQGNLEHSALVKTNIVEIKTLANSFEHMREKVSDARKHITELAYSDSLTALPNRAAFYNFIEHAIKKHENNQNIEGFEAKTIVFVFDLQRFKHINDVLGYTSADKLLQLVADQLYSICVVYQLSCARLSADEFAVLFDYHTQEQFEDFLDLFSKTIEQPHNLMNISVDVLTCGGYSIYPEYAHNAHSLLAQAQMAMYEAKRVKQSVLCYHPNMDAGAAQTISLLGELRSAIESDQLRLFVQPKLNLQDQQIYGLELLVRWEHPERGLVPPLEFIPFAEQTGFIRHLTQWVFKKSTMLNASLREQGYDLTLSLNLSTQDLLDPLLVENFVKTLESSGGSVAKDFCLEITESAFMDDPKKSQLLLENLHSLGFTLSIDDFGTGYSSLSYLKTLPVQELKIDKSFVIQMDTQLEDAKIVRSTIDLAHNLGLMVTAEGIESYKILKSLEGLGCDNAQGYLIGKPMPLDDFFIWAQKSKYNLKLKRTSNPIKMMVV